jgi:hypothetical protein
MDPSRDNNICQRNKGDLYTPKNFTLSIGTSKYRYKNKVQITNSHSATRLNNVSYFVAYIVQNLYTFLNTCAQNFTLSILLRKVQR